MPKLWVGKEPVPAFNKLFNTLTLNSNIFLEQKMKSYPQKMPLREL
jgi:hypothetical protein